MENPDAFTPIVTTRHLEGRLVYTVSSISRRICDDLESDELLADVWIEGEISGLKLHPPSGHYYLTLKDSSSQISCMVFRNSALSIPAMKTLDEGAKVLARGDISLYAPRGTYSFRIKDIRILGRGDLYILFEELKKKLESEGLFDERRKRKLPAFPRTIGIVTSESGAALQDILNILKRRFPIAKILLSPAIVQGENAAPTIINALEKLDFSRKADVIILGRGGGSIEDLWCFNDEKLARTIASCRTPTISAVGHETDFTISDFVADKRAPTPSAAAELAAPDVSELIRSLDGTSRQMRNLIEGALCSETDLLSSLEERLESRRPRTIIEQGYTRCDEMDERLLNTFQSLLADHIKNLENWGERLDNSAPPAVMKRGYALITDHQGNLITSVDSIEEGMELCIGLFDGKITANTTRVNKNDREREEL